MNTKTPNQVDRIVDTLSIIVPVHNEERSLALVLEQLASTCTELEFNNCEIIAVDDGSSDGTISKLEELELKYKQLKIISFTRNFGKEAAIHAGLSCAQGDVAIVIDGDGQHPVELITEMIKRWESGFDVVAACKANRGKEKFLSRLFALSFYKLFKFLTKIDVRGLSDFMLIDRVVIDQYCNLKERQRFFRGMIVWMGYRTDKIYFEVAERISGEGSWGRFNLFLFATSAISSFTSKPLHLISITAIIYTVFSILLGAHTLYEKLSGSAVTGFTTVILLILITGAFLMFGLGQIGLYLEHIFDEIKQRPDYIIVKRRTKKSDNESEK